MVENNNSPSGPRTTKIEHFATWQRGAGTVAGVAALQREMVLSQAPRQCVGDDNVLGVVS